ncbi:MAG: class II aldolase/adducin family protein, partial [Pelagibacteraceae bacterium]|nr:class II aldolase/adducin family protein [Pelagibacteraceae bacterium]
MKNKWNSSEAKKYISHYKKKKISKELALRIYTTHLLGREKDLVLHGGGNTSLKTSKKNIFKQNINVMHIKGSGWDMGSIDYPGMPAVELDPLLKTSKLTRLNDFQMVNLQRKCLVNSQAPNPSVETLLHAFLPFKYVDHTHASAILGLIDQPNDLEVCKAVFSDQVGIVPYIIPGFDLAKLSYKIFSKDQNVIGLILLKHGIFTFGNSAKESYDRMIKLVTIAEKKINKASNKILPKKLKSKNIKPQIVNDLFPLIRKYLSKKEKNGSDAKWVLDLRTNDKILKYLNNPNLKDFSQRGPVTPDHVIRIKPKPLMLNIKHARVKNLDNIVRREIETFKKNYHKYFLRNRKYVSKPIELDTNPRLILSPGLGLIGIGRSKKEAKIASDLAEVTVDVISKAESIGKYKSIPEKEIFKVEYWPLEQAKLKKLKRLSLTGHVTVISGGCGTIGLAIAREFIREGSEIVLLENNTYNIKNTP